ncbi:putative dihydrolipoamide branched chain transacylase E2, partial [Operophtera brumata]
FVKVGDKVQQFDNICEVQSDKAAVTITSRYDGVVTKLYNEVDQTALVGQPLVDIDVDLSTVKSTGRNGRILKEDMLTHLNTDSDSSSAPPDPTVVKAIEIPTTKAHAKVEVLLEDRIVPVTGFTKAMVKSMTEAMKIPHFVFSDEYNVTKLIEARESLKKLAETRGVKLTYMPVIIKAASLSLTHYPILNSSLDSSSENIIYKASHNIGVAMDTPNGLVVPVIKALPRFDSEGNVVKAHLLSTSWSADHRVVDGVTMARFSNKIKDYLENPNTMLLDL